MIPTPTAPMDTASPHPAAAGRNAKPDSGAFESLLAKFGSDDAGDEALPDPSRARADGTDEETSPPQRPKSVRAEPPNPTQTLLQARQPPASPGDAPAADLAARLDKASRTEADSIAAKAAVPSQTPREALTGETPPPADPAGRSATAHTTLQTTAPQTLLAANGTPSPAAAGGPTSPTAAAAAALRSTSTDDGEPGKAPRSDRLLQQQASRPSDDATPPSRRDIADKAQPRAWSGTARADLRTARGAPRLASDTGLVQERPLGSIAVTRRENHFAPVRRPDAIETHQWRHQLPPDTKVTARAEVAHKPAFSAVAEQLTLALDGSRGEADAKLQQATLQAGSAARPLAPVRIVELALQPASLGALSITLRLTGAGLRVTVSASSRETAELLREDREALAALIEGAGYDASEVIVSHRPSTGLPPAATST